MGGQICRTDFIGSRKLKPINIQLSFITIINRSYLAFYKPVAFQFIRAKVAIHAVLDTRKSNK